MKNIDLEIFLEDDTIYLQEIGGAFYSKVPYSKDLVLLYTGDGFKLSKSEMDLIGVYSLSKKEFVAMSNDYSCKKVCDNYASLTIEKLNHDLDKRVQNELLAILEQLVIPSSVLSNSVLEIARDFKMKGEEPIFSFHNYENAEITLKNIEEFYADKDEYAYSIAEQVIQNQKECIQQYQEYVDVMVALSQFSQKIPIDMELEIALKSIMQESNYKNLKVQLLTENGLREESISTNQLKNYPPYALNKVYWGRKLLFDINDYDANKLDTLRTNIQYNIKMIESLNDCHAKTNIFDFVDNRLFADYDFAIYISKKHQTIYGKIDESFRSSMSFIQTCGVDNSYLFKYTPEAVIANCKSYFLNLLKKTPDYYSDFPKSIRDDIDFVCVFIRGKGNSAITKLPEDMFQYDKVQEAFNDWYLETPTPLNLSYYNVSDVKISLLRDYNTKIYALNYSYFEALTEEDLDDESLIMGFLQRIEDRGEKIIDNNFIKIFQNLKKLKTNDVVIDKMIKLTEVTEACWKILDDTMKTKDRQRIFVQADSKLLCLMDDDIKMEFVYDNPKNYLPYLDKKVLNGSYRGKTFYTPKTTIFDEALILDLMRVKGDDIDFLKCLNYQQLSDEKFGWEMMKINKRAYCYLESGLKNNKKFASEAVKEFSVIPYLPGKNKWSTSLFDDKEIMEASLKHSPLDFSDIPQSSRQTGPAPLLSSKDFVLYAIKLDSNNARYIDPKTGFLEDEDICYEAVIDDIDLIVAFAGKLFRNESFVYRLCEGLEKRVDAIQSREVREIWYTEIKEKLMEAVPKKIKETNAFKAKFPMFAV